MFSLGQREKPGVTLSQWNWPGGIFKGIGLLNFSGSLENAGRLISAGGVVVSRMKGLNLGDMLENRLGFSRAYLVWGECGTEWTNRI